MTEIQWLVSQDLWAMLSLVAGRLGMRKLRLFQCACLRRIWHVLTSHGSRQLVEDLERVVDEAHEGELASLSTLSPRSFTAPFWQPEKMASATVIQVVRQAAAEVGPGEPGKQADLLRCIAGNPFRPITRRELTVFPDASDRPLTPAVPASRRLGANAWNPERLAWNSEVIPQLAQAVYADRHLPDGALDGSRLLVLADALEEAGGIHEALITHCRQQGPHARGCFVLDLILAKNHERDGR
jgi:hypothetical protein